MIGATDFLTKVLPWDTAAPGVFFNLHWKFPFSDPKPGRTHGWDGRAYTTLEEFTKGLAYWKTTGIKDFYVCMSAQSRFELVTSKTGRSYNKAIRFQENVVGLKSFYIDVDVKPGAYASTQEAVDAFRRFLEDSNMPDPTVVVGSGSGGFHAHWVVDRSLTLAEWQPVSFALQHACAQYGLIIDGGCTIDSARILRIPDTLNYKSDPPKPVTLMASAALVDYNDIKDTLAEFIGLTPTGNTGLVVYPFERREPTAEGGELGAGVVAYDVHYASIYDIASECPFIEEAIVTGGKEHDNPLWYMSLQVASFSEEQFVAAHLVSSGHRDYVFEATDAEFARVLRDHASKNIGWPKCDKIQQLGSKQCGSCIHFGKHKSPLNFAATPEPTLSPITNIAPAGTPQADIWPLRYTRKQDGFIYISVTDPGGQMIEVKACPYQISAGWLQNNPWVLHFIAVTSVGKIAKIEIPTEEFRGMGGIGKTLAANGIVLNDKEFKSTQEFLLAWVQELQKHKDSVISSTPYGWAMDGKDIEGFTYAGRVWGDGFDRSAAQDDKHLYETFSPHGDLSDWQAACKVITDQLQPALNAIVATAFGGPLMGFTGYNGVQISAFSKESGVGKTSAAETALAVWGHPIKGKQGLDDTSNQLFGKIGKLRSLPIYWDEIQDDAQKQAMVKIIFTLSGGKEKGRMNKDLTQRVTGTWETTLIATSNCSLVEAVMSVNRDHLAGVMRLFEFEIKKTAADAPGKLSVGVAQRIFSRLKESHGNVGLMYAQFLGKNHVRIRKEVAHTFDRFVETYKIQQDERYWAAAMAVIMSGAVYARELQLADIDLAKMEEFLVQTLEEQRKNIISAPVDMHNNDAVSNQLQQFLNAMASRHTLRTNRIHVGQGKPPKNSVAVLNDITRLEGIYVQYGADDHLIRISKSYLSKWLELNKYPKHAFLRALEEKFGFKQINGFLGAGTDRVSGAREYILEANVSDKANVGYLSP